MNTTQKVLLLIAIVAVLAGGLYVLRRAPVVSAPVTTTQTSHTNVAPMVTENIPHKDTYKSYTMKNTYPKSSLTQLPEVYAFVQQAKASFLDDYNSVSDKDAQFQDLSERPYDFQIDTDVATSSKTVTYIIKVYQFEGGAHGGTDVHTFTYDMSGKLVTLQDVFAAPYLSVISPLAEQYFTAKFGSDAQPEMIKDGTQPTEDNFSAWYLTNTTVTFIMQQYQVGPYVIGIQEFPIQKSQIKSILAPTFQ